MYDHKTYIKHNSMTRVARVDEFDNYKGMRPSRGGIILYTMYNNVLYFGLCVDTRTHDLTDAGGTIDYNTDKTAVQGCIREFSEETLNIFESVTKEDLQSCPVVYDAKNVIIFMNIDANPNEVSRRLVERCNQIMEERTKNYEERINSYKQRRKKIASLPEVCGITWLTKESFENSLQTSGVIYSRVRKFLSSCSLNDLYNYL